MLAALLEAALAALFLEHGFEKIEPAIVAAFDGRIEYAITGHVDYKTELQEALARRGQQVVYTVLDAVGPPHERTFTCAATVDGERWASESARPRRRPSRRPPSRCWRGSPSSPRATGRLVRVARRDSPPNRARRGARDPRGHPASRRALSCPPVKLAVACMRSQPPAGPALPYRFASRTSFGGLHSASENDQGSRLQVLPRRGRGAARAGRGGGRGAERLGQVEHRRRDRLGGRLADSRASCGPRSPTTSSSPAAPGKAAVDSCEVELVFDNEAGDGPLDYSELAITRRLQRGARASTWSTGRPVRRIDLVDLLSDLGLGHGMHSIIGQGRVDEVLTSRPADRRTLIEEAAGLGKFKRRRHRAGLKLARVQTQVERALDVEAEVRKRLRPLAHAGERRRAGGEAARSDRLARGAHRRARPGFGGRAPRRDRSEARAGARWRRRRLRAELERLLAERERAEEELADVAGEPRGGSGRALSPARRGRAGGDPARGGRRD